MQELGACVLEANETLHARGLIITPGAGLSAIERARDRVLVPSRETKGTVLECPLEGRPQQHLAAHLVLYRVFPELGAIAQLQSHFATCWAQARKPIPCLGALHASTFQGEIPLTVPLTEVEVVGDYEYHTGKAIARCFRDRDPLACPAALVPGVGPFVWGRTVENALHHAILLEEVARLGWHTLALAPLAQPLERYAQAKHFHTSHTAGALQGP